MCTDRRHPGPIRREAGAGDTEAVQSCKGVCVSRTTALVENKYIKVAIFRKNVTYYKCRKLSHKSHGVCMGSISSLSVQTN